MEKDHGYDLNNEDTGKLLTEVSGKKAGLGVVLILATVIALLLIGIGTFLIISA